MQELTKIKYNYQKIQGQFFLLVLTLLLVFFSTKALAGDPLITTEQAAKKLTDRLTTDKAIIKQKPEHVELLVEDILLPIFDDKLISRLVLGDHWKTATGSQREAFTKGFQKILIRTYASAFAAYDGQEIIFNKPVYDKTKKKALIRSEIRQKNGPPIVVSYKLRLKEQKWLVYDAEIEGIGVVKSYRSQFSDEIRNKGFEQMILGLPS